MAFRIAASGFAVAGSANADPAARASDAQDVESQKAAAWSHSNVWDYALAGTGATALLTYVPLFQDERPPLRWAGPILFDDAVRDAVRVPNGDTRNTMEYLAWALWGTQVAYPLLVDVPIAWARRDRELARDLFWQDAATLTLAAATDVWVRDLVGRARPYVHECLTQGRGNCLDSPEATRSFPGGHMVNSTAASVLTCTQHLYMHLYGAPGDAVACATTLASDVTIGALRVMSDNHWVSDQIVGAAVGALIGWGVPYALHFRQRGSAAHGDAGARDDLRVVVVPMAFPREQGADFGLIGLF